MGNSRRGNMMFTGCALLRYAALVPVFWASKAPSCTTAIISVRAETTGSCSLVWLC